MGICMEDWMMEMAALFTELINNCFNLFFKFKIRSSNCSLFLKMKLYRFNKFTNTAKKFINKINLKLQILTAIFRFHLDTQIIPQNL